MGLKPEFRLVANQEDITATILDRFISLVLTDEAGMESDTLEVRLADHNPLVPIAMPETGAELELYLGYGGLTQNMGLFVVDEVELAGWPACMSIRAKAAPFATSKGGKTDLQTQKTRSWPKGTKLGDLVAKIASEHSMEAAVSESLQGITLPHYDQTEESDMSFLVRLAKRYDAIAKPAGGKLVMTKRGESKTASGEELPTVAVHASQVTSYTMTLAKRDSPGTVIAYWRDKRASKRNEVPVGDGEPVRRLRHNYPDEETAKAAAQAELDKRTRGEHRLSLTMPGDPLLAAETPLEVSGFRDGVDGEWLVSRATHTFTKSGGYSCDLDAEKPNESEGPE